MIDDDQKEILTTDGKEELLLKAARQLEISRSLFTEHEASLLLAESVVSNPLGLSNQDTKSIPDDNSNNIGGNSLPDGIKDGWLAISEIASTAEDLADTTSNNIGKQPQLDYSLKSGQLSKAVRSVSLGMLLKRASSVAQQIVSSQNDDNRIYSQILKEQTNQNDSLDIQQVFSKRIAEIQEYHAKHYVSQVNPAGSQEGLLHDVNLPQKKRKLQNVLADGYDLYSLLYSELVKIQNGTLFSADEVFGKYLDLYSAYDSFLHVWYSFGHGSMSTTDKRSTENKDQKHDSSPHMSYVDFVLLLQKGLPKIAPEASKLSRRKKYIRFLRTLHDYIVSFLNRTVPLLDVNNEVMKVANDLFDQEWGKYGGIAGWECKAAERVLVFTISSGMTPTPDSNDSQISTNIDLVKFESLDELMKETPSDIIKVELARLGMKYGGTSLELAKRLWATKNSKWEDLPSKLFVKGVKPVRKEETNQNLSNPQGFDQERRVDVARLEFIVNALLDQVRPALDATARRAERRLTQTSTEKEHEIVEEISGAYQDRVENPEDENVGDDSEDDDAPVYNPKGVPLGWDGKPIPYWLFKLHGLSHFFPCEICGNECYRGRHNFEKHFVEAKHTYGMKCLGIPNTKHFHGVTKIEDAQHLWSNLQQNINKDVFDASKEEEYEDSHGNVLSRATYEDLARQGLL